MRHYNNNNCCCQRYVTLVTLRGVGTGELNIIGIPMVCTYYTYKLYHHWFFKKNYFLPLVIILRYRVSPRVFNDGVRAFRAVESISSALPDSCCRVLLTSHYMDCFLNPICVPVYVSCLNVNPAAGKPRGINYIAACSRHSRRSIQKMIRVGGVGL